MGKKPILRGYYPFNGLILRSLISKCPSNQDVYIAPWIVRPGREQFPSMTTFP